MNTDVHFIIALHFILCFHFILFLFNVYYFNLNSFLQEGLANMAQRVDVVSTIVQLLTSADSKIKDMVVEIFAVMCVFSSQVWNFLSWGGTGEKGE
jgi:hypothetical protein